MYLNILKIVLIWSSIFVAGNIMKQTPGLHYLSRFRNFTIVSKTGCVYLLNVTINQNKFGEHRISGAVHFAEDSVIKLVEVEVYRCNFEEYACEYLHHLNFSSKFLDKIMYLRNQIWTPFFAEIRPRFQLSYIKKGTYTITNGTFDADAALKLYGRMIENYFFRGYFKLYTAEHELANGCFELQILPVTSRMDKSNKTLFSL